MIAMQSMQSQSRFRHASAQQDDYQQYDDRPQRGGDPAVAPRLGAADLRHRLWRQDEAVAGDDVELLDQGGAAGEEPRHLADEAADLDRAFGGVLDPSDRPEIALDPFAHDRLGHRP